MKLWLLEPRQDLSAGHPWQPWYDKAFGFVVRAETEQQARKLAQEQAGDEKYSSNQWETPAWIDPALSTCIELTEQGEAGVILRHFASA